MLLILIMLTGSFIGGLALTGIFSPTVAQDLGQQAYWLHVGAFSVIVFILLIFIYEEGRRYLNQ